MQSLVNSSLRWNTHGIASYICISFHLGCHTGRLDAYERAGGWSCPLCWEQTGRACVKKKFIVPNLLYYNNSFYCCRMMWQWVIWGGSPCRWCGHEWKQLWAHAGMGLGVSGNARLFGQELWMAHKWVENSWSNERTWTICGLQRPLGTRKGGRGQHVGANFHWMHEWEGTNNMRAPTSIGCADGRVWMAGHMPDWRRWQNKCEILWTSATELYHTLHFTKLDISYIMVENYGFTYGCIWPRLLWWILAAWFWAWLN